MTIPKKVIAVIGATGSQGGSVARSLAANRDFEVLCITRDSSSTKAKSLQALGVKVVQANTENLPDLQSALSGCWGAYVNYTVLKVGKTILAAAEAAGVKHMVFSSDPNTALLTSGQTSIEAMDVKARVERWATTNLKFETFTPVMAGWYLENFQSPELAQFNGGFPQKADSDGYLTCRFPFWGGREDVPWISVSDDYGDLVHGVFLNPLRWNLRVIQAVGDPMSFGELVQTFSKVTGKLARFIPYLSPSELDGGLEGGEANMFTYCQLREGEYYPNGPTENRTAALLKKAAFKAKGNTGRETLMTVQEWFEREYTK
ncbi:hypothetical protein P175DRAFT_0538879 [Aspergillus ochraceoroseus IBT 24754]|uniref:NmrA-like domain-containing protein n=1 Tax=Aspergillus ochraceoroseus IBT 24754 TaxID=1392256 RepID=A0A2T5M8B4_9EURO|nr:uncharacterized protein P175DRAFT_0538879 [Aspergillus ochraceoroseus IBT 24754]PTU24777.1 hypothetical protein P175DRAFT_0538879 [Aspergillus ochraceoroseus IBT 24754]